MIHVALGKVVIARGRNFRLCVDFVDVTMWMSVAVESLSWENDV